MKKIMLLTFLAIFLMSFVFAQEISVDLPSEVSVGEEFEVTLTLIDFPEGTYDVKIDILEEGNRIARIYSDGTWASTYYYLSDSISPSSPETFILKIVENFDSAEIIIKLRPSSGGSSIVFEGYSISSNGAVSQIEEEPEETTEEIPGGTSEEDIEKTGDEKTEENPQTQIISNHSNESSGNVEKITLSSNYVESVENPKALNKEINSAYYLISFCLLLGLLILLKTKKKPKNEFR